MKLLLPAGFAAAAIAIALLLNVAPADFNVDRAQPLVVVTYWQQYGLLLGGCLLLGMAAACLGYFACFDTPRGTGRLSMTSVVALCAISCAIALAVPAVFSSDVYAYAGYGAMAAHGIDPYAHARIAVRDPLLDAVQWQWGNPPPVCVYGPFFVLLARGAAALQAFGASAPLWALRIAACAALVACAPLMYAACRQLPQRARLRAAALVALNPLAVWSCAEGHNDVFAIACLLAGVALFRQRAFVGGVVTALAACIKAPALLAAWALCAAFRNDRARNARIAAGTLLGTMVSAALCVPLIESVVHRLAPQGHYAPHFSVAFLFSLAVAPAVATALTIACALAVAAAGRARLACVVFALWICVPNPYPWYGLWLLPVAAVCAARERRALIAAALLASLRYLGEASSALPWTAEAAIVVLAYGVPAALLFTASTGRASSRRREARTPDLDLALDRLP